MKLRTGLGIICVLLAVPAQAPARQVTPVGRLKAEQAAATVWPGNPCEGRYAVHWAPIDPELEAAGYAYAFADTGRCDLYVSTAMPTAIAACTIIAHEEGHLGGLDHTTRPSLMYPDLSMIPTPMACRQVFPRSTYMTCRVRRRIDHCARVTPARDGHRQYSDESGTIELNGKPAPILE